MKSLIITATGIASLLGLLTGCAAKDILTSYVRPDMSLVRNADMSVCEVEEFNSLGQPERRVQLHLNEQDKAKLEAWLHSLANMNLNLEYQTHKPNLYLRGTGFYIQFCDDRLIVNFANANAAANMHQVSRSPRLEDRQICEWLLSKIAATH